MVLAARLSPHCLLMGIMVGVIPVELASAGMSEGPPGAIDRADPRPTVQVDLCYD